MADFTYDAHRRRQLEGAEAWGVDDYRYLLLSATVESGAHVTIADLLGAGAVECSDASYARVALTNEAVSLAAGVATGDADDVDFGALNNETPVAGVVYRHVDGDPANDVLVAHQTTGFGQAANGAGYVVATPNGLVYIGPPA